VDNVSEGSVGFAGMLGMAAQVHVPGYGVEELIGFGGAGEVWRARDLSSGETVALKRLHVRGSSAAQRLRREAAILAAVAGPHVIGVRAVVIDGNDPVLVLDHAGGGSLATVLAVRGTISPPEVVTVLAPLAAALAAAHARGLVHGDLTPANILFTADGRPMLADYGVAHAVGLPPEVVEGTAGYVDPEVVGGAAVSTASDVYALGAIGQACLAGRDDAPAALVEAIEAAMAPDSLDRPDAGEFAGAVLGACAAGPVVLVGGGGAVEVPVTDAVRAPGRDLPAREATARETPASPRVSSGAYRRRLAIVAAAVVALGLALGLGEAWGRHGRSAAAALPVASPPATASAAAAPAPADRWVSVVQRLATTRSQAFDQADPSLLTSVYLAGTAAYDTDLATVRSLAGRGLRAKGFAATEEQVSVEQADASTARLHVVDRLSGYTLVDAAGVVHGRGDARPARGYTMSLRRTGSGWRITTLTPT
jgi:eukaryotic-like serine/threonine-protein kinase